MKLVKDLDKTALKNQNVTDKQAEDAFRTILSWIGENPNRDGLIETPKRVVKAFKEYFKGYNQDASKELSKTFGDVEGYDDMVVEKNITLESHCEHHMAPVIGVAHVGYIPKDKVVGLSGGYTTDEACTRLKKNNNMGASFSRGLSENLFFNQSQEEFNKAISKNIKMIYEASSS